MLRFLLLLSTKWLNALAYFVNPLTHKISHEHYRGFVLLACPSHSIHSNLACSSIRWIIGFWGEKILSYRTKTDETVPACASLCCKMTATTSRLAGRLLKNTRTYKKWSRREAADNKTSTYAAHLFVSQVQTQFCHFHLCFFWLGERDLLRLGRLWRARVPFGVFLCGAYAHEKE